VSMTLSTKARTRQGKHQVFLVEDHPVTREGLSHLINYQTDLWVCGQTGMAGAALTEIAALKPDLVIVDISLGGTSGIELIKDLVRRDFTLRILVLSAHDESLYAERALRAGARGYVMKHVATEHVMTAIRQVLRGRIYLSERMQTRLLYKVVGGASAALASDLDQLSDRELEVFQLIGEGHGTRKIGAALHLSVSTVESYRAHIKEKLRLENGSELVQRAVKWVSTRDL
jgi:DNA-binding NarL/FixJ family response regulator